MKHAAALFTLLATATAAKAHPASVPHVDGSNAVGWALALILFCGFVALFAER